ncbi:hypothetical protein [Acidocella sp. KAb 2-4]|uniref:hypothetical protein n=1 Tax=Acidocella sp. KAb 2-4 TaxID=2885158 RepID=UPI001D070C54|nr:hypothetical protein [Acidocella sp. KAb 2-4]MCB5944907.1 hypothetical protein [Acidocella sp. KAb 2-4]
MNPPFTLPDWLPSWALLLLALPALLWALAFLLMPFSVFGLKSRLEALEAQVDTLQDDIRMLGMRMSGALPPAARNLEPYEDVPDFGRLKRGRPAAPPPPEPEEPAPRRAPIPTPQAFRERLTPTPQPQHQPRPRRTEPRLD